MCAAAEKDKGLILDAPCVRVYVSEDVSAWSSHVVFSAVEEYTRLCAHNPGSAVQWSVPKVCTDD